MGFRFRRRVRIMPGFWLNVSKSGVSTSIGRRGATLNLSSKGTRTTVGLPGSGLAYRSPLRPWGNRPERRDFPLGPDATPPPRGATALVVAAVLVVLGVLFVVAVAR